MHRALYLASLGQGRVSPNPMVGCVIVHQGEIIGEGFHEIYGGPHAEVNAVNHVKDKNLLSEATVYVSLEPCAHFGKTPPCADLLVASKVKEVVVAMQDPYEEVAGQGIAKLKAAGIEVEIGVLEAAARELNRRFLTRVEKQRPYIILKWAQSKDGYLGSGTAERIVLSDKPAQTLLHQWRTEEQAILVGSKTALLDNPQLDVRLVTGKNPQRILLDAKGEVPNSAKMLQSEGAWVYTSSLNKKEGNSEWVALNTSDKKEFLQAMLADLAKRKVNSILVEGGASVLNSFLDSGLYDEIRILESEKVLGKGLADPKLSVQLEETLHLGTDRVLTYRLP